MRGASQPSGDDHPLDLQRTLGMTGGNIFHGALSWPFADNDVRGHTGTGRSRDHERIMLLARVAVAAGRCRASAAAPR